MKKGGNRDPDLLMRILNSMARPRNRGTPLNLMLGRAFNGNLPNQINEDWKLLQNYSEDERSRYVCQGQRKDFEI